MEKKQLVQCDKCYVCRFFLGDIARIQIRPSRLESRLWGPADTANLGVG